MAENKVVKGEVLGVVSQPPPARAEPVAAGRVLERAGHKPEASSAMDEDDRIKMHGCAPPDFRARARALALRPPPRASDRLSPPPSRTPFAFCRPRAGG